MKKKTLDILGRIACLFGAGLFLGAVGAFECGTYAWDVTLAQIGVGFLLILAGLLALSNTNEKEED